jgi:patatin-like phospholipase/acyl hydrolase
VTDAYRILALDGGGLRGIFTTAVLVEAEDAFGPAFLESFDLLVGTSTGGIIALGLASGRTCREMLEFYRRAGPEIFRRPRRIRRFIRPKYDRRTLDRILQDHFGETLRMNDLRKPVCITAYEMVSGTTRVWKDDHSPGLRWGGDQLVWKVAASTSAAPTYFGPVQLGDVDSHVDGGVWGTNPAMVGIAEAIRYAGRDLAQVRLLSIGTTSTPLRVGSHEEAERMGLRQWMSKGLNLIQDSSAMATTNLARFLLGEGRYLRIDSESARRVAMDDAEQCRPLQEWGHDVGRKSIVAVGRLLGLEMNR